MKKEYVLFSTVKGVASKLASKYSSPYEVIKAHSPIVYDLRSKSGKTVKRVHVKDLKQYH